MGVDKNGKAKAPANAQPDLQSQNKYHQHLIRHLELQHKSDKYSDYHPDDKILLDY